MNFIFMWNSSFIFRFSLAFVPLAAITAVFTLLDGVLDTTLVALLYLMPLGIITARWALGPGNLAENIREEDFDLKGTFLRARQQVE